MANITSNYLQISPCEPNTVVNIAFIFDVRECSNGHGIQIPGFHLKPNKYGINTGNIGIKDWNWMIEKFD